MTNKQLLVTKIVIILKTILSVFKITLILIMSHFESSMFHIHATVVTMFVSAPSS